MLRRPAVSAAGRASLSKLKNHRQQVTIPGFYDQVKKYSRQELKQIKTDAQQFKTTAQAFNYVSEPGYSPSLMPKIRPSLDINGIIAGFTGEGAKTVIPAEAHAKVSMRLVPDQDPEQIADKFINYLTKLVPQGVELKVELHSSSAPVLVSKAGSLISAAKKSLKQTFGLHPELSYEGGTIGAVEIFKRILKINGVIMGYSLPGDNAHAPNERFYLPNFYKGIENNTRFYKLTSSQSTW